MAIDSRHTPATDSSPLASEAACYARAAAAMEVAAELASSPPIDLGQIMAQLRAARQDLLTADDVANEREPGRAHIAGTVLAMRRIGLRQQEVARTERPRLAALMREDAALIRAAAPHGSHQDIAGADVFLNNGQGVVRSRASAERRR